MKKILFINHEISPFVPDSALAEMGRRVPQLAQENGYEIRTFMPKWGNINERKGQLHEVQRLSGMNIIIDDTDHPLIIKVASLPQTKVQVYFIDNDEYFFKRHKAEEENDTNVAENGERAVFFARGVIETIKKLRWSPDIIHCQGWMSSLVPLYIKKAYNDEPSVCNAKVVTSLFDCNETKPLGSNIKNKIAFKDITIDSLSEFNDEFSYDDLAKLAITHSDGIIAASETLDPSYMEIAKSTDTKILPYTTGDAIAEKYIGLYESLFE